MADEEFVQRLDALTGNISPEALKAQDGKKVPLTDQPGGRVIGEATLKYNEEDEVLEAHFQVSDPKMMNVLRESPFPYSIKKES